MKNVLIAGGSGLIGSKLIQYLTANQYSVSLLTRSKKKIQKNNQYYWNPETGEIDEIAIQNADYVINLCGTGIADKNWTTKRKKEIIDSRTKPIDFLYQMCKKLNKKLDGFISASATGYYGSVTTNSIFTESDECGSDFVAQVCKTWEDATIPLEEICKRLVVIRISVVLSPNGGMLKKVLAPFKYHLGTGLGTGKQYIPWIHIDDMCRAIQFCLENNEVSGKINVTATEHITNNEMTRKIAENLSKKILFPNVPSLIMKLLYGEMACIILEGSRVSNQKLLKHGFQFLYPEMNDALKNLIKK